MSLSTTSDTNVLGINCCPQFNSKCCGVKITLERNEDGDAVVTIRNQTCYKIQKFLRFSVGPVAQNSAELIAIDPPPSNSVQEEAQILYYEQSTFSGFNVVIRYNRVLCPCESIEFTIRGVFAKYVTACITCFVPDVKSCCDALAVQQRDAQRSTARGINCCLDVCSNPVCFCNYFLLNTPNVMPVVESMYRLNPATSVATFVGNLTLNGEAVTDIRALAMNPLTAVVYALGSTSGILYTVDPQTAALTTVASTATANVLSIAFNSQGELFGWVSEGGTPKANSLVQFNLTTGAVTTIGLFGTTTYQGAIAFDSQDRLYLKFSTAISGTTGVTLREINVNNAKTIEGTVVNLPDASANIPETTSTLQFFCNDDENVHTIVRQHNALENNVSYLANIVVATGDVSLIGGFIVDDSSNPVHNVDALAC